jgi:AcrR family transcriptional regulator
LAENDDSTVGERPKRGRPPRFFDTKARLREVATDLFHRRGVRAVGIDEITAQAGMTKPALYRHFGSKDGMVEDCVEAEAQRLLATADALLADVGRGCDGLRGLGRLFAVDPLTGEGRGLLLLNAAAEYPEADHPVRELVAGAMEALHARLLDALCGQGAHPRQAIAAADHILLLVQGASAGCHSLGARVAIGALGCAIETVLRHHGVADPAERSAAPYERAH